MPDNLIIHYVDHKKETGIMKLKKVIVIDTITHLEIKTYITIAFIKVCVSNTSKSLIALD